MIDAEERERFNELSFVWAMLVAFDEKGWDGGLSAPASASG